MKKIEKKWVVPWGSSFVKVMSREKMLFLESITNVLLGKMQHTASKCVMLLGANNNNSK